jgi:hypothetical protein
MVDAREVEQDFKAKVCEKLRVESEGVNRYRVFTPFRFDDGDHLAIALKHVSGNWLLTDEGHTFMHLTYDIDERDLLRGTRQRIITNTLSAFGIQDNDGELILPIPGERFGDALYSFVQGLLKIADLSFLTRERARSTFMEDFYALIDRHVPENRRKFNWHDAMADPAGKYPVDCRVNGMPEPLFIFALPSDDKVRDATISAFHFEAQRMPFRAIGIFENQEDINRKVLARFSDVCEKQFSSLFSNEDRIGEYLRRAVSSISASEGFREESPGEQ